MGEGYSSSSSYHVKVKSTPKFGLEWEFDKNSENLSYSLVFGDNVNDMVQVTQEIRRRLKVKDTILKLSYFNVVPFQPPNLNPVEFDNGVIMYFMV